MKTRQIFFEKKTRFGHGILGGPKPSQPLQDRVKRRCSLYKGKEE
jgi:hypothetical protein